MPHDSMRHDLDRRQLLHGAAAAVTAAAFSSSRGSAQVAGAVPNSSGVETPKLVAPAGACDCHHHIYDSRFPVARPNARFLDNARVDDYRLLQRRLGLTRDIVVTPVPFPASVADNMMTLDALKTLGPDARGVAIVSAEITDAELKALADAGVRGIRFSVANARKAGEPIPAATTAAIVALSRRVNDLGWHVQFNIDADQIVAVEDMLDRLPAPIVFDHMGHMPQPEGIAHPAYAIIRRIVDRGRTWVKLSVTYDSSKDGPPGYSDVNKVGAAYVQAVPERLVWGSNWPHPNETNKPDDAMLFDLLAAWAPDAKTQRRILVENPETLYGFAKAG